MASISYSTDYKFTKPQAQYLLKAGKAYPILTNMIGLYSNQVIDLDSVISNLYRQNRLTEEIYKLELRKEKARTLLIASISGTAGIVIGTILGILIIK